MKFGRIIFLTIFLFVFINPGYAATNVSSCGTLSTPNEIYILNQSVNASDTCFTIGADNITLDGAGYTVNYSRSAAGYAVTDSGGYDNITVKNLNIVQGNASVSGSNAIYGSGMSASRILNNTITTYGTWSQGIRLFTSSGNLFANNTITTYASQAHSLFLGSSSSFNVITNNNLTTYGNPGHVELYVDSNSNIIAENYITSYAGYGIYLYYSNNNNTFSNNTIISGGYVAVYVSSQNNTNISGNRIISTRDNAYAVRNLYGINSTFENNLMTTSGTNSPGIDLYASSTIVLLNNTIMTSGTDSYGISIRSSGINNITGGSIIAQQSVDYYLQDTGTTSNFTNTNFTASRKIYFYDTTSWFNYNNETSGNIWIKTSVSSASTLTRELYLWNNTSMKWNDSASGITATYNLTGLLADTGYRVYTQTASSGLYNNYNLTTDSSGALPSFQISLNGDTEISVQNYSLPEVLFLNPTDDDGLFVNRTWTYVNVSVSAQHGDIDTTMLVLDGISELMACVGAFPNYVCSINKTGLADGIHAYYAWVNDSFGDSVRTATRMLTTHAAPPSFLSWDRTYTPYSYIEPNFTVSDQYFSWLNFNWNNSNYSFYNDSLVLSMSFDSNPSIGETSSKVVDVSKYGNNGTLYGVLRASYSMIASSNSYLYEDISSVTDYTIQSGDDLEYDVYWTSSTDFIAFDYTTSDDATLRDSGSLDQNGLNAHPAASLAAYAQNVWYHRKIALPASHVGKTITYYDVASEYDSTATKTAYLDNIVITDGAGTVRKEIYRGGLFTHSLHLINGGSLISLDNYVNPAASVSGRFGSAVTLDGVDDYMNLSNIISLPGDFTLTAWVKKNSSSIQSISGNSSDTSGSASKIIFLANNNIFVRVLGGGASVNFNTSYNISLDNSWVFLTVQRNASDTILASINAGTMNYSTTPLSGTMRINLLGRNFDGQYFNGTIDEVRIWNRSLSADEIRMQYQSNFRKYNQTTWNFYSNISGLSDGNHTYRAFAGDTAGFSAQLTRTLTVDMTPPSASLSLSSSQIDPGESVMITCSSSDLYWSSDALNVTKPSGSAVSTECGQSFSDTSEEGAYVVSYLAADAAGNSVLVSQAFYVFPLDGHFVLFTLSSSEISPIVNSTKKYAASNLANTTAMAVIARGAMNNIRGASSDSITVNQSLSNNNIYLVFTRGVWANMEERVDMLDTRTFAEYTRPTFGYPLNKEYTAVIGMDYSKKGINIIGDMQLAPGIYIFSVENMGFRNRKPIINVTRQ